MINTLYYSNILICFACLLQSLELLQLQPFYKRGSAWDWGILKLNKNKFSIFFQSLFLKNSNYISLLVLGVLASVLGLVTSNYYVLPVLFFSTIMTSIRWGGTFNGGSDYMTLLVLLASSLAFVLPEIAAYFWMYLGVKLFYHILFLGLLN